MLTPDPCTCTWLPDSLPGMTCEHRQSCHEEEWTRAWPRSTNVRVVAVTHPDTHTHGNPTGVQAGTQKWGFSREGTRNGRQPPPGS